MHLVPGTDEVGDEMRTGKAGDAGGQNPHGARRYRGANGYVSALALDHPRNYAPRMLGTRRPSRRLTCAVVVGLACALAAVLLMAGSAGASGSPQDVIRDFDVDGLIDGQWDRDAEIDVRHTVSDLQHAKSLMAAQQPGLLAIFIDRADEAISQALLGTAPSQAAAPADQPRVPQVDVPFWTVLAAFAAGVLAIGGVGSAIYRRSRRRVA